MGKRRRPRLGVSRASVNVCGTGSSLVQDLDDYQFHWRRHSGMLQDMADPTARPVSSSPSLFGNQALSEIPILLPIPLPASD